MIEARSRSFADLVGFDPSKLGAAEQETHGTTVLAVRYDEGVLVLADRRATMGNLIMFDQAEKIEAIDDTMVIAISGAYARSIEVCRFLKHSLKYYERINLYEVSAEGKLMEVSRALAGNMQMAMQGVGVFLPIAAVYDSKKDAFLVSFFDAAGARFQSGDYAAAGSGSERIRGSFNYIERTKGPWRSRPLEEVGKEAMMLLDIAADLDSATGGSDKVLPSARLLTREGVTRVGPESVSGWKQG